MAQWSETEAAHYTSASADRYFDWDDGPRKGAKALAKMFLERFPNVAREGYGADWEYSGWFVWMLAQTSEYVLPYAFSEYESPADILPTTGSVVLSLPPPGEVVD